MTHQLRPYQIETIAAIEHEWEHGVKRTMISLATGLGKTTIFSEIARRRRDRSMGRTLVLAHRKELITQAAERLSQSGLSVEIESGDQRASRFALSDVVVATVQTLRGSRLQLWGRDSFTCIIVDECHRICSPLYLDILDHFPSAVVLGVTATPDRGDKVALSSVFETCCATYSLAFGIENGYLCKLRALQVPLDDITLDDVRTTAQEHGRDLDPKQLASKFEDEKPLHAVAAELKKLCGQRPTLVFMPSVLSSQKLAIVLSAYVGAERVASLNSTSSPEVRAETLARYQAGELQFLVNCALFTEGFDAPLTSCVAVVRPTKSRALYAQMIGRGTRLADGKEDCLVLDFAPVNTKHDLAKIVDIYEGKDMPPDERADFAAAMAAGEDAHEAARQAKEKAEARARAAAEQLEALQRQARIIATSRYEARERQLFAGDSILGLTASDFEGKKATLKQRRALELARCPVAPDETQKSAEAKLLAIGRRRSMKLCTVKQASKLAQLGLNPDMSRKQADVVMSLLSGCGWRVTPQVRAAAAPQSARH